jgi:PKD repeat protein
MKTKDVKAKIMNLGTNSPGTFNVFAQFGSNAPSSIAVSTTMPSNGILSVTIPNVDFTGRGILPLKVWTELVGEQDTWDDTLQIDVNNKYLPSDPTEKGDTFCQAYNFAYYITKTDPEDRVMWYRSPTDFLPFMEQDSINIVNFQKDSTIYVSKGTSESIYARPYDFSFGATSYATAVNGMVFDVIEKESVLFQQVTVYAKNPGNSGLVRLRRYGLPVPGCPDVPTGAFTTAGSKIITLNWMLPPGHDYQISYIAAATNPVPIARISPTAQDPSWGISCRIKIKTPITLGVDFSYEYFFNFKFRFFGCETARKRIDLTLKKSPIVNLLDTNRICSNPPFSICGPNPASGDTYTYQWSSYAGSDTTKCYKVTTSSPYEITVTNQLGCKGYDSTYIIVDQSPVFSVNDTFFCKNQTVTVDSKLTPDNNLVQWTGFTTGYGGGTGQTQTLGLPGTYYVTAYSKNNNLCATTDTFTVTQKDLPIVEIGTQQIYCGSTAVLGQNLIGTNMSYVWAPTGDLTKNITVSQSGTYSVIGTDMTTGCVNYDTTTITIKPKPAFDLGADINTCGTSVVINGPTNGKYYYHWSNNQTSKSIIVTTSGKYLLTVTDSFSGCSSVDSVIVNFNNQLPIFDLGTDSATCLTALTLKAPLMGSQYSYSWSGPLSGTASTLTINKTGVYKLVINNGCYSYADSIKITFMNSSLGLIDLLKDTVASCNVASLTATSNPTNATIIWSIPGNPRGNTITVSNSGSVSVSMSNQCGSATKSAYVRIDHTPIADFTIVYPSSTIPLIGLGDLSTNAVTYNWSFGDGKTSTISNPSHQYVAPGEYLVTLVVSNTCGSSSISKKTNKLNLVGSGIVTTIDEADLILYPNPANTYSKLVASNIQNGDYAIEMYNALGQLVLTKVTSVKNQMFDEELKIDLFASGEYLVKVTNQKDGLSMIKKLQINK